MKRGDARTWPKYLGFSVLFAIALVLSGLIGASLSRNFGSSNYTLSYADFISVLLTAISVLLTVLGLILAILAFVGWRSITGTVENTTRSFLDEGFEEGNALHDLVMTRTTEIIFRGIQDIDAGNAADDAGEVAGAPK